MKDVVARLQRELPDTDRDRYDIAYERGRAQARSGLLLGGLAVGSAIGAGLMWLLDPTRGAGRRAELANRATGLKNDLSRTASGRAQDVGNRVSGFAIERGVKQPPEGETHGHPHPDDASYAGSYAAAAANSPAGGTDFGPGYREGFGATQADPTAPGAQVPDPIKPEEVEEYGPSGPVAGAAHEERPSVISRETEEEEAAATSR